MKADLAIYGLIVGMSGQWEDVATMLNIKLDFCCCDNSVGFCKSSHILSIPHMGKLLSGETCTLKIDILSMHFHIATS